MVSGFGPANVLLDFGRQGVQRTFGLVTEAGGLVARAHGSKFGRDATDSRKHR